MSNIARVARHLARAASSTTPVPCGKNHEIGVMKFARAGLS